MKTKILSILSVAFAVFALTALASVEVMAQKGKAKDTKQTKTIDLKSSKGSTGRGADPNIKTDSGANDPDAKTSAPPAKGGTARGGGVCEVKVDNSTQWTIKIFVDGSYRGAIGGWDDAHLYTGNGLTTVYGRADFTDGSYRYWGPKEYNCLPGQYISFRMVD